MRTHNIVLWPAGKNSNSFYRLQWLRQQEEGFVWTCWGRSVAIICRGCHLPGSILQMGKSYAGSIQGIKGLPG